MEVFANFEKATLDDYHPHNDSQRHAKDEAQTYIDELTRNFELGRGMLWIGPAGVGKTMLSNIVLNGARTFGYTTEAIAVAEFFDIHNRLMDLGRLDKLIQGERWEEADRWSAMVEHLETLRRDTHFVLFDDVGKEYESNNQWTRNRFDYFVRSRYVRGLPTLLTSNIPVDKWAISYSDSMASFLRESSIIVPVVADDER